MSFLHWNRYHQLRPAPVGRLDFHVASDDAEALAHADQSEALFPAANRHRRRVEAHAVVAYVTANRTILALKSNPHRSCPSVLDHVVQCLLGYVIQGRFNAPWQSLLRRRVDADLKLG